MRNRGTLVSVAACAATLALTAAMAAAETAGAPAVTTGAASEVTTSGAKLVGTVTPRGQATTYAFDYGTSTAYGSSTTSRSAGSGTTAQGADATLTGLKAGTTYHYRLVAANASGTTAGADATFTTAAPPTVSTGAPTAVTASGASLSASVNPKGHATKVVFDYGTSTSYGASTAVQDVGQGTASVTVKATLTGLKAGTTYHVRARATSDTGSANGSDRTFKTTTVSTPLATTGDATGIGPRAATLSGAVTGRGAATQAYFEYGPTTAYGKTTPPTAAGAGSAAVAVRHVVAGLAPSTTYHFRIVAVSVAGTVRGTDKSLKTGAAPAVALTAQPPVARYGGSVLLVGRVGGTGAAGATVTLFSNPFPFAGFGQRGAAVSDKDGGFRFASGALKQTTRFFARVTAAGETVESKALRVGVRPAVRYSIRRVAGGRLRFSGTIRPAGAATVYLRRVGPRATVTVRRTRAVRADGAGSTFRMTIRAPSKRSIFRLRVRTDSHALTRFDSAPRAVQGR